MPINAEFIRELTVRREGPALDFKSEQYDWSAGGNAELAKDLMAMANGLSPTSSPAYILIGVEEDSDKTSRIVGVARSSHLDDACMQQKVRSLLNCSPRFLYSPVEVDGMSVGVFEIYPGGRPFFPPKDNPKLAKHQALIRSGTSTDVATPIQIQSWAREDERLDRQQRVHDGMSRVLGFLMEAVRGNPFHWSKYAIHCKTLFENKDVLKAMKDGLDTFSFEMHPLQEKCVIESAHEGYPSICALSSAAFQLSSEHGLIWLSVIGSVSQLSSLYPFVKRSDVFGKRIIRRGEDTFSLAFYELVEQMLRFEEARDLL